MNHDESALSLLCCGIIALHLVSPTLCILANDEGLGFLVGLLQVIVDDNFVVRCLGAPCKLHLDLGLVEPLEDVCLLVCGTAPQAVLEHVHVRWGKE